MYGKYGTDDTIRYQYWRSDGTLWTDETETNAWYRLYYPRHYPYKNIANSEKPYDLIYAWEIGDTNRMWAL